MVPGTYGPALTALLVTKLALKSTPNTAVTVTELVPTEVDREPEAIVLVAVPLTEVVTTDVMKHLEAGGMTVPIGNVSDPAPGAADTVPKLQPIVVVTAGVVFTIPAGYGSVKRAVSVAETSAWVFEIEIVNRAVPPAVMLLGVKLLETDGLDKPIVSVSEAVHV